MKFEHQNLCTYVSVFLSQIYSKNKQKALPKVSTRSKTIKRPVITTSQRITRSSTSQNKEIKPTLYNSTQDIKPSKTELDYKSSSPPKNISGPKKKPLKRYGKKKLPKYPCSICPRVCSKYCTLVTHMMTKHETKEKSYFCKKCNKGFTAEANLRRHFDLHAYDDTKPFACSVCDSRFPNQERLDRHTLTHGRIYRCNQCGTEYNDKQRFDR